jgi:hypothetical protein
MQLHNAATQRSPPEIAGYEKMNGFLIAGFLVELLVISLALRNWWRNRNGRVAEGIVQGRNAHRPSL